MVKKYTSPEETLTEIRNLMERSSRFISLSGMSGVMAGIYALLGVIGAHVYLNRHGITVRQDYEALERGGAGMFLLASAAIVLVLAVGTGILLTTRKAKNDGNSLLDSAAKKLLVNLCIPLLAGGVFCLAFALNDHWQYVVPSMLVFYGLALVNASKYTRNDVRSLGVAEMLVGVAALFVNEYGLVFWGIGFGLLHIAYGTYMYFKYEK